MSLPRSLLQELEKVSKLRHLECDGMTRVASYLLTVAGVAHEACIGYVTLIDVPRWVKKRTITHHWWLEFEAHGEVFIIDYRARMWLLTKPFVAHGVFQKTKFPKTVYSEKRRGPLDTSNLMFEILTRPMPPPLESEVPLTPEKRLALEAQWEKFHRGPRPRPEILTPPSAGLGSA